MRTGILMLAMAASAFGQLDDNTLTITANRTTSLQPDRVAITLYFSTAVGTSLDEAVGALQAAGIAAADLSAVSSVQDAELQWVFNRTVSLPQLGTALASIGKLQAGLSKGLSLNYSVQGQVSAEAQQSAALCPMTTLVSDARVQAQRVADVAGVKVGPVVSLTERPQFAPIAIPTLAFRAGDFSSLSGGGGSAISSFIVGVLSPVPLTTASSCSITVQFKLLP